MLSDDDLAREIEAASATALPAIVGVLARAQAVALARLIVSRPELPAAGEPVRLLTPEEAAAIAGVPPRRIYSWSKGQKWATRPSRRCLRIHERGFRRWLEARTT